MTKFIETRGGGDTAQGRREREKGRPLGLLFLFFAVLLAPNFGTSAETDPSDFTPLVIATETGRHVFEVELAATKESQTRGLMFRDALAPGRGMLFDYGTPRHISMWMKDTLIPLDMVFLDQAGRVLKVSVNAVPGSLESINSGEWARAVLELLAGTVARIDVRQGDKVYHQVFGDRPLVPEDKTQANAHGG